MAKTQSESSRKSRSIGPKAILVWIVAVMLFLLMLSSVVGLFIKYRAMRTHITELKQEQVALEEKKISLSGTNEYLQTPEGKEQIFRDKYRLVKPGEGIIVITKDSPTAEPVSTKPSFTRFWNSIMRGLGLR